MAVISYTQAIEVNGRNKFVVKLDRSDSILYDMRIVVGGYSETLLYKAEASFKEASFAIPVDWLDAFPDTAKGIAKLVWDEYNIKGEYIRTVTKEFSVIVPIDYKPTIELVTAEVVNNYSGLLGHNIAVYGFSNARLTPDGVRLSYGSPIVSYTITSGGNTHIINGNQYGVITPLKQIGDVSFSVKVTDARGRTSNEETSNSIHVQGYSRPLISLADVYRCDANGNKAADGEYMRIIAKASISNLKTEQGESVNKLTLWASWSGDGGGNGRQDLPVGEAVYVGIDKTRTYDVSIYARDILMDTVAYRTVPCENVAINIKNGGKAVGIGKYAIYDNHFEVAFDSKFEGKADFYGDVYFGANEIRGALQGYGNVELIKTYTTPGGYTYYGDFNEYLTPGVYGVESNNDAATLLNIPVARAGTLRVYASNGVYDPAVTAGLRIQEYVVFDATAVYRRMIAISNTGELSCSKWYCYAPAS